MVSTLLGFKAIVVGTQGAPLITCLNADSTKLR